MTEQRIKNIEERITLAGLLPGVNLDCLPLEESAKLKRAVLDLYRRFHASGFEAGADYAMNAAASVIPPRRIVLQMPLLKRSLSAQMRKYWRDFIKSLRSIRARVIRSPQPRRFPTEALSGNWAICQGRHRERF